MIGIITLNGNRGYNFGCLLQNYALKKHINNSGISAEAIECGSFSILGACCVDIYRTLYLDINKEQKKILPAGKIDCAKNAACESFIAHHISPLKFRYFNAQVHAEIAKRYDAVIVGSDQVWNPHWAVHDKSASTYLLQFLPPEKRISYAASFGVSELPGYQKERYADALKDFRAISVREDAGKRIVEELTGRTDVQVLVDPTMLLTTDQWNQIAHKPRAPMPEKYLLTYFLGDVAAERRALIEEKARQLDCQIIDLMDKNSPFYAIGPDHFVYLVKHAAYVCTDSFHGSVFSFLYGKPLAIFDRVGGVGNMSSRLQTLANKFSLQACMVADDHLPDAAHTDYTQGYRTLEQGREKAKAFLTMVLKEAEGAGLCK